VLKTRAAVVMERWRSNDEREEIRKIGPYEACASARVVYFLPQVVGMRSVCMIRRGTKVRSGGKNPRTICEKLLSKYGNRAVLTRPARIGTVSNAQFGVQSCRLDMIEVGREIGVSRSAMAKSELAVLKPRR